MIIIYSEGRVISYGWKINIIDKQTRTNNCTVVANLGANIISSEYGSLILIILLMSRAVQLYIHWWRGNEIN